MVYLLRLVGQLKYNKFIAWTCKIFKEVISSNLAEQFHTKTIFFTSVLYCSSIQPLGLCLEYKVIAKFLFS